MADAHSSLVLCMAAKNGRSLPVVAMVVGAEEHQQGEAAVAQGQVRGKGSQLWEKET